MKAIDLTIPLGIQTPPWPTYEPLQLKYFKRLAPNGANGQVLTHSNHVGTHLDGEIHFYTPGKDIASLDFDFLMHEGVIVDISDACGDYDIYSSQMLEERAEIHDGDILIIHTGYHRFGWDQPTADEIRYMLKHPGPDREFAEWARRRRLRWIAVDCGSADHPFNTAIRGWCPRQLAECQQHFKEKYGKRVEEIFDDSKYQLMHIELFNHHIIHAECVGGDIDLLLNQRALIGCFPWRFVDGEASISRIVAFVDDDRYELLMREKSGRLKSRFGDVLCDGPAARTSRPEEATAREFHVDVEPARRREPTMELPPVAEAPRPSPSRGKAPRPAAGAGPAASRSTQRRARRRGR